MLLPELNTIHFWQIHLSDFFSQYDDLFSLLNPAEKKRALRFHFDIHRQRFVTCRSILRQILSQYVDMDPKELIFSEGIHAKPFLKKNPDLIDFNLSHSDNLMICAIGYHLAIGLDIEKISINYDMRIAERFFSVYENTLLNSLSDPEKMQIFFQLWTGKEAITKMTGKGLWAALSSFSIDPETNYQTIVLNKKHKMCHLKFLKVHPEYACSLATTRKIECIKNFTYKNNKISTHAVSQIILEE